MISMNDILYIQNNTININASKNLYRLNSVRLWESKIDYYESKIKEKIVINDSYFEPELKKFNTF